MTSAPSFRWLSPSPLHSQGPRFGSASLKPQLFACMLASAEAGRPASLGGNLDTMMTCLACGEVSALAWAILKDHGDAVMALPDEAAIEMMRRLANPAAGEPAIVAGESAVAGLAGLMAAAGDKDARATLGLGPDARVLVFGTEGDTDPELYKELVGKDASAVLKARR